MTTERAIELLNRISDSQFDGIHGDERREALEMAVRALSGDGDLISRKMAIEAFEPTHYMDWYTPTIIETLETLPSVRPEVLACGNGELVKESDGLVKDLVKDCISRQMAIDAMRKLQKWNIMREDYKNVGFSYDDVMFTLEKLTSAQPEITEDDVKEYCRKRCLIVVSSDFYDEMTRRWASAQPETHDKRTETHECDLISRQQAIDALDKHIDTFDAIDTNYLCGLRTAMSILKEMPSAQPERKRGHWIDMDSDLEKYDDIKCSCCKHEFTVDAYHWTDIGFIKDDLNFCPNCGADMRGESDE